MQFPCHKVAHAGNSTSSFSISAILHSCIFGYSCFLSANISIITWHPSIIFFWIELVYIYRNAFNPLAAKWHVLCQQGFSSSVCQAVAGATQTSTSKVYQQCWKEWAGWCAQQGLPNDAISASKLANFFLHLFQVGLVWHTIGIYHSAISAFLQTHHIHKASYHPVILKLMHHFYLQHPPSRKQFDPWDVEHLLSLLENWAPASSLTAFKLALLALVTAKHCSDLTLQCCHFHSPVWWQDRTSGSSLPSGSYWIFLQC